jgi:hypothetical protein
MAAWSRRLRLIAYAWSEGGEQTRPGQHKIFARHTRGLRTLSSLCELLSHFALVKGKLDFSIEIFWKIYYRISKEREE